MDNLSSERPEVNKRLAHKLLKKIVAEYRAECGDNVSQLSKRRFRPFGGTHGIDKWGRDFFYQPVINSSIHGVLQDCMDELVELGYLKHAPSNDIAYELTVKGLKSDKFLFNLNLFANEYAGFLSVLAIIIALFKD